MRPVIDRAYVLSRADGWCVLVGDCDDGMIVKYCVDMDKSQRALDDLITLAPFAMHELDAFGYHWD